MIEFWPSGVNCLFGMAVFGLVWPNKVRVRIALLHFDVKLVGVLYRRRLAMLRRLPM